MTTDTREALAAPTDEQLEAMIAAWFETSGTFKQRMRAALATQPAQQQADERGDMAMREWHRECDDADTILRALGLDPVNCRTDGGSLKTGMILDALQARDRMLQRSAPAAPSSCGWTDCKNMPKCDFCKAWDSMGI